ncbi:MAG: hypothetical protein RL333_1118, partial [Pseudomonadota bacterium]
SSRGNPTGLRVTNETLDPSACLKTNFWELRGLSRAGFATDDNDLMGKDRLQNFLPPI